MDWSLYQILHILNIQWYRHATVLLLTGRSTLLSVITITQSSQWRLFSRIGYQLILSLIQILTLSNQQSARSAIHSLKVYTVFSSPERHSGRAIVLPPALALVLASTNVKVFVKVFKTSLFPNLIIDLIHLWYDDTYWSKILHSIIPTTVGHVKSKFLGSHYFCTKRWILFLFGIMVDTGQKFLSAPSALMTVTLRLRSQT